MATEKPNFEHALAELTEIVEKMEKGDLPLEEAIAAYERGMKLGKTCQKALKHAEQVVTKYESQAQDNNTDDDA